jgi:hypothetical protein
MLSMDVLRTVRRGDTPSQIHRAPATISGGLAEFRGKMVTNVTGSFDGKNRLFVKIVWSDRSIGIYEGVVETYDSKTAKIHGKTWDYYNPGHQAKFFSKGWTCFEPSI